MTFSSAATLALGSLLVLATGCTEPTGPPPPIGLQPPAPPAALLSTYIYLAQADGSGIRKLAQGWSYAWSPNGKQIAFSSDGDGDFEIFVMNADGSNQTQLTHNSTREGGIVWSPDGTRIAFESASENALRNIFVMNADGSNQRQLTTGYSLAWSPDGSKIAFNRSEDEGAGFWNDGAVRDAELLVINADGTHQKPVSTGLDPVWSPNGQQIAFTSYRDGNPAVFVMNADGSSQTLLTPGNPPFVWSPDGSKIAVAVHNHSDIAIVSVNASAPGTIIRSASNAAWSPDGTRITFTRRE